MICKMAIESPQHGHKARCYSIRTATMNSHLRPAQCVHQGEGCGRGTDRGGDRQSVRRRAAALAVRAVLSTPRSTNDHGRPLRAGAGILTLLPPDRACRSGEGVDRDIPGVHLRHALGSAFPWGQITVSTMAGCGVVLAGKALATRFAWGHGGEGPRQRLLDQGRARYLQGFATPGA